MADETQAAASSEVTTRPMTEEERLRYPPQRPTKQDVLSHIDAHRTAHQLAEAYGISVRRAGALMALHGAKREGRPGQIPHVPSGLMEPNREAAYFVGHNNIDLMAEKAVRRSRPMPTEVHGDDEETAAAVRALLVEPGSRRDATKDPAEILIDEEERNEMAATATTTWTKDELLTALHRARLNYADPGLVALARVLNTTLARLAPAVADLGGLEALKAELGAAEHPTPEPADAELPGDPDFEVREYSEPETPADHDAEAHRDPPIVEYIDQALHQPILSPPASADGTGYYGTPPAEPAPAPRSDRPDCDATATIQMRALFVEPPASSDSGDAITVRLRGPKTIEAIRHCIDVLALAAGDGPVEITLQARVVIR